MLNLNQEQQAAVKSSLQSHCIVDSGAGTGKTRVIVERLVYLLDNEVQPEKIWLLTFTNAAARDMLSRAAAQHPDSGRVTCSGTFHSVAAKLLRQAARHVESMIASNGANYKELAVSQWLESKFSILDADEARKGLKKIIKELPDDEKDELPPAGQVQGIISAAANRRKSVFELSSEDCGSIMEKIAEEYRKRKVEKGFFDFDDLLDNLLRLLRSGLEYEFLSASYVLVDEFQDVNQTQTEILVELARAGAQVYAVGDPCQSIYRFRGAEVQTILNFCGIFPGAERHELSVNYRSSDPILDLANKISNKAGLPKTLSSGISGPEPVITTPADEEAEASGLVGHIAGMLGDGVSPEQICILSKSGRYTRRIEMHLAKRKIRYLKRGGLQLGRLRCVGDLAAFFRIRIFDKDQVAWQRLCEAAKGCGLGGGKGTGELLSEIERLPARRPCTDFIVDDDWCYRYTPGPGPQIGILPPGENKCVNRHRCQGVCELIAGAGQQAIVDYEPSGKNKEVGEALKRTILQLYAIKGDDPQRVQKVAKLAVDWLMIIAKGRYESAKLAEKDFEQLLGLAGEYITEEEFLDSISLETSSSVEDSSGRIVVSTVHSAKGLEWDHVFIVGATEDHWPTEIGGPEQINELYRLGYVGSTRAAKNLVISAPKRANIYGQWVDCCLSEVFK